MKKFCLTTYHPKYMYKTQNREFLSKSSFISVWEIFKGHRLHYPSVHHYLESLMNDSTTNYPKVSVYPTYGTSTLTHIGEFRLQSSTETETTSQKKDTKRELSPFNLNFEPMNINRKRVTSFPIPTSRWEL